ncbi:MAG TPA: hypothetical protein VKZ84_01720 [Bacteriovoracaceae bacterium]|nr:hypothetical protein [Bacteriovoracaceae bacterium]
MKYLLLTLGLTLISSTGFANSSAKLWNKLSLENKEKLLDAHLEFYEEYSLIHQEDLAQLQPPKNILSIINSAYASSGMDCIYAGWPSKRVSGLCSTPVRHNPGYEAGNCKSNELQCQPMLFGSGFCVPTSTQKQRSLAFSNCTQKFNQSGRTARDVIAEVEASSKQNELFEVMGHAEKICSEGKQASTPMCRRLEQVVADLKKVDVKPLEEEKKETPPTPPQVEEKKEVPPTPPTPPTPPKEEKRETPPTPPKAPEVIIEGKKEENSQVKDDFIKTVEQAGKINSQTNSAGMIMCETNVPFERTQPRADSISIGSRHLDNNIQRLIFNDSKGNEYNKGVRITMKGPNSLAPVVADGPTDRQWDFISDDNALNATYIQVTDSPTPGTLSHLMETIYVLIPRKEIPRAETKGDEIHVTLPTGEMVIYDAKTKLIKKGAMSEKAIDTNSNRFQRKFTTDYVGEGISIRVDRRGGDPRTGSGNVTITQKGKKCTLPKSQVWGGTDDRPAFKYNDDKRLVDVLNSKCSAKFSL